MTALSSALWRRFSHSSNFVNGHVLTMWFMVCRWSQTQEGDLARPHLCKSARHGPWPVRKRLIGDNVWRGRLKPGCRIVGSVIFTNSVVDHRSRRPVLSPLRDCVDRCHVWPATTSLGSRKTVVVLKPFTRCDVLLIIIFLLAVLWMCVLST